MTKDSPYWSQMADELVSSWTEAGTQLWKSWFELMGVRSHGSPAEDMKSEFKYLAQRFADNQGLMLRFLQLSFKAWQDILPKVEAGEDWQQTLQKYSQQMRDRLEEFAKGTMAVSQDATQLWQIYLKETQKFSQLWMASLGSFLRPMSKAIGGTTEPWLELNNLYWNLLYEESFGSVMQSPILGPTREFTGKVLRGFDAWATLYRASLDYQVVLADVQVRSFEELMRELVSLAEKDQKIEDWRQFQQIWSQVADRVFEDAFCSEDNLKIRGQFLNALNTYRIYQQDLMELWMKALNIPVRSEVDEIHQNIYELRREVKRLKKALAKQEGEEVGVLG